VLVAHPDLSNILLSWDTCRSHILGRRHGMGTRVDPATTIGARGWRTPGMPTCMHRDSLCRRFPGRDNATATNLELSENSNSPGDGKFDNDSIPNPNYLNIAVGAASISGALSGFYSQQGLDEKGLLARYLDRDHAFSPRTDRCQP